MSKTSNYIHMLTAGFAKAAAVKSGDTACALWFYQQKLPEKLRSFNHRK